VIRVFAVARGSRRRSASLPLHVAVEGLIRIGRPSGDLPFLRQDSIELTTIEPDTTTFRAGIDQYFAALQLHEARTARRTPHGLARVAQWSSRTGVDWKADADQPLCTEKSQNVAKDPLRLSNVASGDLVDEGLCIDRSRDELSDPLGVEPESLKHARVLRQIDLCWELQLGQRELLRRALLPNQIEHLLLVDQHDRNRAAWIFESGWAPTNGLTEPTDGAMRLSPLAIRVVGQDFGQLYTGRRAGAEPVQTL
jgi:hypothetical protein